MALAGTFDGQEKESVLWRFIDLTSVGVERCPLCRWGEHCHCSSQVSRPVKRKQILFGIFYCVFQILEKVAIVNWFLFQFKNKDCSLFWSKALSPTSVSLINFSSHYFHCSLSCIFIADQEHIKEKVKDQVRLSKTLRLFR